MATLKRPVLTFINLSDNPGDGRDERRNLVRRAVMLGYHERRKQLDYHGRPATSKGTPRTVNSLEVMDSGTSTGDTGAGKLHSQADSGPTKTIPKPKSRETIPSSRHGNLDGLPCRLETRATRLLQPMHWTDPQHAHTSALIRTFLRGQPMKAARNLTHVAFVHRRFGDEVRINLENPLKRCGRLLRRFLVNGGVATPERQVELWDSVHEEQERLYRQVSDSRTLARAIVLGDGFCYESVSTHEWWQTD
jgi:hypothetical protein